jgi:hypothetical protein
MPLELGIAMARRFAAKELGCDHDWLVLVPEGHSYARFISDLAGYDPKTHNATVETLIPKVTSWLATRPDATQSINPSIVLNALPSFTLETSNLKQQWLGEVPWADTVLAAKNVAERM